MSTWPRPTQPEVARFVRLIGPAATFALVDTLGGTALYLPRRLDPRSRIVEVVGTTAAQALCSEYGGNELRVPLARDWRILVHRRNGLAYPAIALAVGCTESTVWRTLNRAGRTDLGDDPMVANQLSLFD